MKQTIRHWRQKSPFTETGRTFGAIDHVLPGISGGDVGFIVRGWFFDLNAPVSQTTCRMGNQAPLLLTHGCCRPDVQQAFPSIYASTFSGFMASFPRSIDTIEERLGISYCAKGEDTEVSFTLPLPETPWLFQKETFSVIAVVTSATAVSELYEWSARNKPDLILYSENMCSGQLVDQFNKLKEEFNIRAYHEGTLNLFLKTYLTSETQVILFGDTGEANGKIIQDTLEIGRAETTLRVKPSYVKP